MRFIVLNELTLNFLTQLIRHLKYPQVEDKKGENHEKKLIGPQHFSGQLLFLLAALLISSIITVTI